MAKRSKPRSGTLQFQPRKRAKRTFARIRSWPDNKQALPQGFAGYKVGMTHLLVTDNRDKSLTKGKDIQMPATIIECPPIKIAAIVFFKKSPYGLFPCSALFSDKLDKELGRKIKLPKKSRGKEAESFDDVRVLVYTQPKLTTIGRKKPELFELALGGKKDDKLKWAKENLGNEVKVSDIIKEGQLLDSHAITTGKGFQGTTKRMGTSLRSHKSEKGVRGPGNLGCWIGNRSYTVAHPGQHGFHQRTEVNKWVIKIGDKPEDVNKIAGFRSYGLVKNTYLLIKGSIQGPKRRLILFTHAARPNHLVPSSAPEIQFISR